MKELMNHNEIYILTEYPQKADWENSLRVLWKTCFGDPQHYENFYFDNVYTNNKVYALQDKGMIHVNSYRCKVMGHEMMLPYIVGVATDKQYRRQGVMRKLLEQVLSDLHREGVPFVYLMPAKEEYYLPFGFRSVTMKKECLVTNTCVQSTKQIQYLRYEEFCKQPKDFRLQLLEQINQWLEQRYDVYALHDKDYYELLYREKACQSGNVVFCFEDSINADMLCGVFAYAMDADIPYVEQMLVKESMLQGLDIREELVCLYFDTCTNIKIAQSYPYMFRIVHREAFLKLFEEKLATMTDKSVNEMPDEQIIECLFKEKDNIYFAEIV